MDRPWVEVTVSLAGSSHRVWCIVDTGADDTILDVGTAAVLGVNRLALPKTTVKGVSGSATSFARQPGVQLDFAGTSVTDTVLFGSVSVPVLGRSALLSASGGVAVEFVTTSWSHS
ncbi:MAG TPA: aspartyl protease family protein [Acidimicrobiia bacterium]